MLVVWAKVSTYYIVSIWTWDSCLFPDATDYTEKLCALESRSISRQLDSAERPNRTFGSGAAVCEPWSPISQLLLSFSPPLSTSSPSSSFTSIQKTDCIPPPPPFSVLFAASADFSLLLFLFTPPLCVSCVKEEEEDHPASLCRFARG